MCIVECLPLPATDAAGGGFHSRLRIAELCCRVVYQPRQSLRDISYVLKEYTGVLFLEVRIFENENAFGLLSYVIYFI